MQNLWTDVRYGLRTLAPAPMPSARVTRATSVKPGPFMRTLLYGISPADPITYVGVALVLLSLAFGACALPAFRAARVDPKEALRYE